MNEKATNLINNKIEEFLFENQEITSHNGTKKKIMFIGNVADYISKYMVVNPKHSRRHENKLFGYSNPYNQDERDEFISEIKAYTEEMGVEVRCEKNGDLFLEKEIFI